MNTRVALRAGLSATALALVLAGCGGGDAAPTEDSDTDQAGEQEEAPSDDTAEDEPADGEPAEEDTATAGGTITLTVDGETTEFTVTECVGGDDLLGITAEPADGSSELRVRRGEGMQDTVSDAIEIVRDGMVVLSNADRGSTAEGGPVLFEVDGTAIEGDGITFFNEDNALVEGSIAGSCG